MVVDGPKLLVTGASGLVGTALAAACPVLALPRGAAGSALRWTPQAEDGGSGQVQDDGTVIGAVVHMAGVNVASGRWSASRKRAIRDSRVIGTRTLVDWLNARVQRPAVLICASGINAYGHREEELVNEESGFGAGFMADLVRDWEAEAFRATESGIRVVCLRLGMVLSTAGGGLAKMLPAFRLGMGGALGSGRQWLPWIHIDDVVGIIEWALANDSVEGPLNVVAPGLVRQGEFACALGRALGRPAVLPAPRAALRLVFGELADEALLASVRAEPARLEALGYRFRHPEITGALDDLLD